MPISNIGFGQTGILNWAQTWIYDFDKSRFCRVIKLDFLHKLCLISVIANSICVTFLSWLAAAWSPEMQFNQFFVFSLCLIFISKLIQLQYATNIWNKGVSLFLTPAQRICQFWEGREMKKLYLQKKVIGRKQQGWRKYKF